MERLLLGFAIASFSTLLASSAKSIAELVTKYLRRSFKNQGITIKTRDGREIRNISLSQLNDKNEVNKLIELIKENSSKK